MGIGAACLGFVVSNSNFIRLTPAGAGLHSFACAKNEARKHTAVAVALRVPELI